MSAFDKLMAIRGLPLPEKDEVSITGSGPCSEHTFPTGRQQHRRRLLALGLRSMICGN
jgi:hypothetical protein